MTTRSRSLTLVLGLVVGLMACQDQGVVAPDDLGPEFAKVKPCQPWPACNGSTTATLTLAEGIILLAAKGLAISDDDRSLQVHGPFGIQNNLTSSGFDWDDDMDGNYGECKTSPADADPNMVKLLADELVMASAPLDTDVEGTTVAVNKVELRGSVRMTYRSQNLCSSSIACPENGKVGLISFGVRESGLFDFGIPEVTPFDDNANPREFTISGGAAIVWWRGVKHKHRITLVCPNGDDIKVIVEEETP